MKIFLFFCALVNVAVAQREPTLADLESVSSAAVQAAQAYLAAARSTGVSASEMTTTQGCLRDTVSGECVGFLQKSNSFLQKRGVLRPLIARVMGDEETASGEYERKTQAPLVFLHLHM